MPPRLDSTREAAMNVKDILSHKGDEVLTIEPTATLAAAVQMLTQRRIGALVVTGAGNQHCRDHLRARHRAQALDAKGAGRARGSGCRGDDPQGRDLRENDTIAEIMEQMTLRQVPPCPGGRARVAWSASSRSATWSRRGSTS